MQPIKAIAVIAIFALSKISAAQETGFGFSLSLVKSNLSFKGNRPVNGEGILKPALSAFSYLDVSDRFGWFMDLSYVVIGTSYTDSLYTGFVNSGNVGEDHPRIGMVRWSILPTFKFSENLFVAAGPVVDMSMRRGFKGDLFNSFGEDHAIPSKYLADSRDKTFTGGIALSAGYTTGIARFDLRYVLGLGNLFDTSIASYNPGYENYTSASYNSIQATIGILIPGIGLGTSSGMWEFNR